MNPYPNVISVDNFYELVANIISSRILKGLLEPLQLTAVRNSLVYSDPV